jgi:hypothetical protein
MDNDVTPPSQQPKRFFDIAPPKDFVPSATSRPLLAPKDPQQPDPMMVVQAPHHQFPLAPELASQLGTSAESEETDETALLDPGDAVALPAETPEGMMNREYDEVQHEIPADFGEPVADAHDNQTSAPITSDPVEPLQDAETAGALSPAVVMHHHPSPRLMRDIVITLLVVVLLVVAADVLLDAQVWKPTYNFPHTHLLHK